MQTFFGQAKITQRVRYKHVFSVFAPPNYQKSSTTPAGACEATRSEEKRTE